MQYSRCVNMLKKKAGLVLLLLVHFGLNSLFHVISCKFLASNQSIKIQLNHFFAF